MAAVVDPRTGCRYAAEYAKSSRSRCKSCSSTIDQGELRLAAMIQSPHFDGLMATWYHPRCFFKTFTALEADIKGFEELRWGDQEIVRTGISAKGRASNAKGSASNAKGSASKTARKTSSTGTLSYKVERGEDGSKCASCKKKIAKNNLRIGSNPKSGWRHTECFVSERETLQFFASASSLDGFTDLLKEDQAELSSVLKVRKGQKRGRDDGAESGAKKAKTDSKLKAQNVKFYKFRDALEEHLDKDGWTSLLRQNGQAILPGNDSLLDGCADLLCFGKLGPCSQCKSGQLVYQSGRGYSCLGRMSEWTKCDHTTDLPSRSAPSIPPGLFSNTEPILQNYKYKPEVRLICKATGSTAKTKRPTKEEKKWTDTATTQTLKLKGGAYVDPDSTLDLDEVHVHKEADGKLWSVVLGIVDIQRGVNSYYKLQLIKHDEYHRWYVFRSWGRVGTNIGGSKLDEFGSGKSNAERFFLTTFSEKTGNDWGSADFVKHAGKFFPLELDIGDSSGSSNVCAANSKSKLAKPIQQFVEMIFDIKQMKNAMMEFEIDLTKMPLGKLSKKQLQAAYTILGEVQDMIKNKSGSKMQYLDASNRFYTLIPHDFGMKSPPLLDNTKLVRKKITMVDNLLEIEIAYSLLNSGSSDEDPIDEHYKKLNTDFTVLDRKSSEWKIIQRYVKNTHAATHTDYTLEIQDIFSISRHGESQRFKKYEKLRNHKLLWHGSRTTNFAGILSQGLRIAPPEAPVTGYMFGKGVYFADMVSKSANYCCTSRENPIGAMLLCEVALGDAYERLRAEFVQKLPAGKHHCKGIGQTAPREADAEKVEDVVVPCGKGVGTKVKSNLLYNEYIVYDVAQIRAKYLLKLKFNHKY